MNKRFLSATICVLLLLMPVTALSCAPEQVSDLEGKDILSTEAGPQPGDKLVNVQASYPPLTLEDLVRESDAIVVGKVVDILSARIDTTERPGQTIIYTDVIVETERYLYPESGAERITIRVKGDRVGDTTMIVASEPTFSVGEEVCLFLRRPSRELMPPSGIKTADYYRVTAGELGKGKHIW
ncbi:MAG: hypothetical protein DRI40_06080 [Chloroflexi bacterium]|nr:MAG: hypothetical protein DRI40_06080 [Chloroflexota bacterium]